MHPFDRLLFRRSLAFTAVATLLALGVVLATDEPMSTPAMRVARMAAFAPLLVTLGASVALAQARAKGELSALSALGASPWRLVRGAVLAGWVVGALAVALLVSPWADVGVLFPALPSHAAWSPDAAALLDPASGVRVTASGAIGFVGARAAARAAAPPGQLAALFAVAPLAAVAPPWAGARLSLLSRALGAGLALGLAVVLLHAVASGRAPAPALMLAAVPLAVQCLAGAGARPGRTAAGGRPT